MACVTDAGDVLAAARARADAMVAHDSNVLRSLLHPHFRWTSHTGERFDRESYVQSNHQGPTTWFAQVLEDVHVQVVRDTAVLSCTVRDQVGLGGGPPETFVMPMTQTWVRDDRWLCLAGHAGPRLDQVAGRRPRPAI